MRRLPQLGGPATVVWLGAQEAGVIEAVGEGGREVDVVTESGELVRFRLGADGHFHAAGRAARLLLG